jgi:Predicted transcriptional regulator
MSLGGVLRAYRLNMDLSLVKVASILSVDKQTVWRWENDKRSPSINQIGLLADLYEVPANDRGVFLNPTLPLEPIKGRASRAKGIQPKAAA